MLNLIFYNDIVNDMYIGSDEIVFYLKFCCNWLFINMDKFNIFIDFCCNII